MRIKTYLPSLFLLGAIGCAPQPQSGAAAKPTAGAEASKEPEMVCKRERPTGSSISRKVCRRKDDGSGAQAELEQIQRGSSRANNPQ